MSLTPQPRRAAAITLPARAGAARVFLFVLAPLAFLTVVLYAGTDARLREELLAPAIAVAAVLVYVGMRITRDHHPAPTAEAGPLVRRRSRWDWTDVAAFLPATVGMAFLTASLLVGATQAFDGSLAAPARTAVESFANQAAIYSAAVAALGVLVVLRRGLRVPDLGWRLPRPLGRAGWLPWLGIAVVVTILALYAAQELGSFAQQLLPNSPNTQCTSVRDEYGGYVAVAIPLVCVIAPLAEETIFRGFFYGWLRRHLPVLPAVLICSAVFALAHAVVVLALPLFAVGVILALLYEYSGSLIPGAIVHGLFNLVGILAILGATTSC